MTGPGINPWGPQGWGEGRFMQAMARFGARQDRSRGLGLVGTGLLAALLLSGCGGGNGVDWDLRNNGSNTSGAVEQATSARPTPDQNGVISYPGYQVIVARQGDTVTTLAARVAVSPDQLAKFNALSAGDTLRAGEVLALPVRVAAADAGTDPGPAPATPQSGTTTPGGLDISAIATTALDRVDATGHPTTGTAPANGKLPFSTQTSGPVPVRYQVKRGETAFTIARSFNISAKALADWNGLGPDLSVREGQYLIIPTPQDAARLPAAPDTTPPGQGSPLPEPPSASQPLPDQPTPTASDVAKTLPPSPDLSASRTTTSAAQFTMPVDGKVIRAYQKKVNEGVDISANAGDPVKAAAAGSVAAVTHDPSGAIIVVIKHAGGLLTVYTGIEGVTVAQGATVTRGQVFAKVAAGSPAHVHFEVRKGLDSVDPMPYLQ